MTKFKNKNLIQAGIILFMGSLFLTSCLNKDDDTSAKEAEAKLKLDNMLTAYGMTKYDSIGYGVYMKYRTQNTSDTTKPLAADYALISYTGYDSEGNIIETSDSLTAVQKEIFSSIMIYGPTKIRVRSTLPGVYWALLRMHQKEAVTLIIPADMAFGNYEPVRYEVSLDKIIKNEAQYETDQRNAYKAAIGFNGIYNSDNTLEYKITREGTSIDPPEYYNKVKISLHAYFAEWEEGLFDTLPSRMFFPINKKSDTISYFYQYTTGFPLTEAIDSMIISMKKHEIREFITTSQNAYGEEGFVPDGYGFYIVPRYMSIHYIVELIDITQN